MRRRVGTYRKVRSKHTIGAHVKAGWRGEGLDRAGLALLASYLGQKPPTFQKGLSRQLPTFSEMIEVRRKC